MKNKILTLFLTLVVVLFSGMIFSFTTHVRAIGTPVNGFAWADGIGWISLSCENGGPQGANICFEDGDDDLVVNYGISIEDNGTITGYAWSDNLGWIRFDGGCPGGVTGYCNAQKVGNEWVGFAKIVNMDGGDEWCFIPASGNNNNCGMQDGEWASYISLSSLNDHGRITTGMQNSETDTVPEYGVAQSLDGVISGFAWNQLVGWIEFDATTSEFIVEPPGPFNLSGDQTYCPSEVVDTTLSWTPQTVLCQANWYPMGIPPNTSSWNIIASTIDPGVNTYTLTCTDNEGVTLSDSAVITVLSETDTQCLDIEDPNNPNNPDLVNITPEMCENDSQNPIPLSWTSPAVSCTVNGPGVLGGPIFNGNDTAQVNVPLSPGTYSYSVTCDGFTSNVVEIDVFSEAECALDDDEEDDDGGGGIKPIFEEF